MAEEGDHVPDRKLGDAHATRGRRIHDDDFPLGSFVHVDVVDPDPRAAHDLEARSAREHVLRDLGPAPDDQGLIIRDRGQEGFRVQLPQNDLVGLAEHLDGGPIDSVRDQDLHRVAPDAREE